MYLRVKKDSVTSILLFIFNVFLVERGIYSVPLKKIFILLEPFHKSETSIRMGLSRGVQNGLFVNEREGPEVYYRLTDDAGQSFDYWHKTLARFQNRIKLQFADWDQAWNIIWLNLSPLNKSDGNIEKFMESLEQLGYGSLTKEQWISPYDLSGEVIELAEKLDLKKGLFIFHGELKNKKPAAIVSEVWPVRELAKRYSKYADQMQEAVGQLNAESNFFGQALTFLYLYGSGIFEIIQDDPQLPLELLPADWQGPKVTRSFWEIREKVLPEVNSYIDEILKS